MKNLWLLGFVFLGWSQAQAQRCPNPVDPKKIVVMLAFNDLGAEEKGARDGACARGETLVIFPRPDQQNPKAKAIEEENERLIAEYRSIYAQRGCDPLRGSCQFSNSEFDRVSSLQERMRELIDQRENLTSEYSLRGDMKSFLDKAKADGAKVSSLIVSGHDGGGHFYGDHGETTMGEITELTSTYPETFKDLSTLLLMGCWSGTPDQVDMWRATFPKMRVLGGFVGSAPASTRAASGTYITGLLKGEKTLARGASKSAVKAMLDRVQNLNVVTAGVLVAPSCVEDETGKAFYYVSPAQADNELPEDMHPGLSEYKPVTDQEQQCVTRFEENYDWDRVLQYFEGEKEPENSPELRGIYSYLRNNEFCFRQGFVEPAIGPDEVLFLRFYQDMKKNFGKYHNDALSEMYKSLDEMIEKSGDLELQAQLKSHKRLLGESLTKMTRAETLREISNLTGIFDKVASANPEAPQVPQIRQTMQVIDTQLHRLKCMSPTWHEYVEGETLSPPTCTSAE